MEERKQSFVLFGYRLFYVFLLSAVFYLGFGRWLPFRETALLHLFLMAVLSAGVSAADSLKGRNYLYALIVFAVVYAVVVLGQWDPPEEGAASSGRLFFRETVYLMIIVLTVYLWNLFAEKFVWVRRTAAILLCGGLVAAMICKWQIPHLGVAAALLFIAAVAAEYIESGWEKQKQGTMAAYLLWLLPFLMGYFVLTAVMPYKDTPYDWALFVNAYKRVHEKVVAYTENLFHFGDEDFGISTTGFSEESGFFGNLARKDRAVMVIENPNHYKGNLYLTGRNYDSFDGRQWTQTATGEERDCYLNVLETLCAVYGFDREHSLDYLRERSIGVQYRYFHTKYLFAPLTTCRVKHAKSGTESGQRGGSFVFAKKQGYGTSYQLSYYQMNRNDQAIGRLLGEAEGAVGQEAFDRAIKDLSGLAGKVSLPDLLSYQERMKNDYSGEIEIGPEVYRFLEEALAGADTDYEKMVCLESALSSLIYNERPGKLPGDVDTEEKFLDYFLVGSREGYCSYFASAFVLLAREAGLPARYVQGYVVPLEGKEFVEVTAGMAHAWPEVWFDGAGWVQFEPTPVYYGQGRVSWEVHKAEEGSAETVDEAAKKKWENQGRNPDEKSVEELQAQQREAERKRRRELLEFLAFFLLILLGLAVLLLAADALLERKREAKRSPEEKFRLEALRNLQIISALGYSRYGSETLSELGGRLEGENIALLDEFIAVCEEVLYGGRRPDKELLIQSALARRELFGKLKEKKGKMYFLSRISLYLTRAR